MATAGAGPSPAPSSGYEGGAGVGGKFRKRPLRKSNATPYDRPLSALRNPSWLSKLVLDPASNLIASGAQRFFASVFRKRLPAPAPPPPPPPPPPELNQDSSNGHRGTVKKAEAQEAAVGDDKIVTRRMDVGAFSDLEQLLKKITFTRSEVDRLMELLHSRAADSPLKDCIRTDTNICTMFANSERQQHFLTSPSEEKSTETDRSPGLISMPGYSARVLEEDIAAPAEIAKAYMGSRASKVSPSMLGLRGRAIREEAPLLSNVPFTPKSSTISMATNAGAHVEVPENGFTTPRSRGRSAIYHMARAPYSRVNPSTFEKGSGSRSYGFAGPLLLAPSVKEPSIAIGSSRMALKRRSSVLDDDLGSVGPIRRIRQKSSVLSHKTFLPQGNEGVSVTRQYPLTDERAFKGSKFNGENDNTRTSRTSYAHVPSRSSELGAKILEHIEKIATPSAKSAELKLVTAGERSPAKLTVDMLRGKALKSHEYTDSTNLFHSDQVGDKFEGWSHSKEVGAHVTTEKQDRKDENGLQKFDSQHYMVTPVESCEITTSIKVGNLISVGATGSVANLVVQHPDKKRPFMISAHEDSLDLVNFSGHESEVLPKGSANPETALNQNSASGEKSLLNKIPALPEGKPAEPMLNKKNGLESGDEANVGQGKAGISFPTPLAADTSFPVVTAAPLSLVFENLKRTTDKVLGSENSPLPSVTELSDPKPLSLMHSKPETLSSSDGVAATVANNSSSRIAGSETSIGNNLVEAANGTLGPLHSVASSSTSSGGVPSLIPDASSNNGALAVSFSNFSSISAPASSVFSFLSNGTSSLTSAGSLNTVAATSISAASSGAPLSFSEAAPLPKVPIFKFGSLANPSISAFSASNAENTVTKTGKEENTNNASNLPFGSTLFGSGSSIFGLSAATTSSTAISQSQSSLSSSGSGSMLNTHSSMAGAGTPSVTEGNSALFGSSSSSPVFGTSGVVSFTPDNNLFSSSTTASTLPVASTHLGTSSSVSLSETMSVGPSSGATPNIFTFNAPSSSGTNAISSNSGSAPTFSFSATTSAIASATNTVSPRSAAAPVFAFGKSSPAGNLFSSSSGVFGVSSLSIAPETNPATSSGAIPGVFGSSWPTPSTSPFSSAFSSPSTGFSFGGSSSFNSSNTAPMAFGSSTGGPSGPGFSFATGSVSSSSPSPLFGQSTFGSSTPSFAAALGNNDQMNPEDSMAEDPVQSSSTAPPVFGQQPVSPSPGGFVFGSTMPSQTGLFQFGGQQNQAAPQNTPLFQATGSQEFSGAGGSFSLGSGGGIGGDKSGRKYIRVTSRNKNRKK